MRCRPSAALEGQKEEKKKQALKDWSAFAQVMSEGKERGRRYSNTGWGHYSENNRRSKRERCKKSSRTEDGERIKGLNLKKKKKISFCFPLMKYR